LTLTDTERAETARLLRVAERDVAPIEPVSARFPGIDLADTYAVQRANIARRLAAGAVVVGHKVGLTNRAMQRLLGVGHPDFGHLLDDMVHEDGATIPAGRYCRPRIEPEICFRLARPLRGPGVTIEDVLAATEAVAPALELVDSRIRDWRITLLDTVADNASAAGLVCGPWTPLNETVDLVAETVDLRVDGKPAGSGSGHEVLGHPAAAVAWLADTLAEFGTVLEPGHLVLPGAMTTAPFVSAGQTVGARFGTLGSVSITFS
jgi:2-oxo-3-hexenedioate decarboxylase/2-keto-4-pentenoate hydratase